MNRLTFFESGDRAGQFADLADAFEVETVQTSFFSPGPVRNNEQLVRFVSSPMHLSKKKPELMPNFVDYAFSRGLSLQRTEHSHPAEAAKASARIIQKNTKGCWLGYVEVNVQAVRALQLSADERAFNIYDTADADNCGHCEIGMAYRMPEADKVEAAADLLMAFSPLRSRKALFDGATWEAFDSALKLRPVPPEFASIAA